VVSEEMDVDRISLEFGTLQKVTSGFSPAEAGGFSPRVSYVFSVISTLVVVRDGWSKLSSIVASVPEDKPILAWHEVPGKHRPRR